MKCITCRKENYVTRKVNVIDLGVNLGRFFARVCTKCGERYFTEYTVGKIQSAQKKAGLWGADARAKARKKQNFVKKPSAKSESGEIPNGIAKKAFGAFANLH